jgi:phosphate-selective porin
MEGHAFHDWEFKLQTNVASGSVLGENDRLLEDAYLQYTKYGMAQPWLGQGKAWFGRQELISSGKLQFVDRSIASERFAAKRHVGVGLVGITESDTFEYNVGIYNGEGLNKKDNPGGDFLYVGRVVYTPFGEYKLSESAFDYPESSKLAIGISAFRNTAPATTRTELQVVTDETTGLPTGEIVEISLPDDPETDVDRLGLEIAYKIRGFNAIGEYYTETAEPDGGSDSDTDGWYAQLAYLFPNRKLEVAGRYSEISPDTAGPSADLSEAGVAVSYYLSEHDYKIQADYRVLGNDVAPDADADELRLQMQFVF